MSKREIRLVEWIDSSHKEGWIDPQELTDFGFSICVTVGHVLRDDEAEVLLAQSFDQRFGNVDAVMAIPVAAITKSVTLRKGSA